MSLAPEAPAAVGRHAAAFVLITVLLDMVAFGLIMPVLPRLIEEVGRLTIDRAAVIGGWMFAAFSLAQFVFAPMMGNLADRFGRRPLLLLAIFGLGLDFILMALAPDLAWLFAGRVIAGVCGASWVIASAYIADVTAPEARARAYGRLGAAFGVGFVIGPAVGGLLGELGPRVPFWAAAGVSLLNFVYGIVVLPESLPPARRRRFEPWRANPFGAFRVLSTHRGVLPMVLVLGLFFFSTSVYPAVWAFWGIARFGWSEAMIGATLAVFGLVAGVFQGVLTGPATARFGEWRVALFGLVCATLAVVGYGLVSTLAGVFLLMVLHGPEGFVHPLFTALLTRQVPENAQGELQGGIAAVTNLSMLFGTVFFAAIFGHFWAEDRAWRSTDVAFQVAACLLAGTTLLFAMMKRSGKT